MPVIFLGDVAIDSNYPSSVAFKEELVIANLEGQISSTSHLKRRVVYNSPDSIEFLLSSGINGVSLANNHIFDLGDNLSLTIKMLQRAGIGFTGAGHSLEDARKPISHVVDGKKIVVFAAGWHVVGCKRAKPECPGVLPLEPQILFDLLEKEKKADPDSVVIFYLHWNYELELYPQPAHRQLAFELVDRGASAIVGAHSHCVQGVEHVGEGVIVHGLGNWMLPHGKYFNGKLAFPEFSSRQLAFHFDTDMSKHRFDLYEFDGDGLIRSLGDCDPNTGYLEELTPYRDMTHRDYVKWFRSNRRKKKLLPVYIDYRHRLRNGMRDRFVAVRQRLLDKMVEYGIKGGPK